MTAVTATQLAEARAHMIGRVQEFDDGDIASKLAVYGLEVDAVHELLMDAWAGCQAGDPVVFVRGFVEGLLTALQLRHD